LTHHLFWSSLKTFQVDFSDSVGPPVQLPSQQAIWCVWDSSDILAEYYEPIYGTCTIMMNGI
jgi:hypothetical protein